MKYLNNNDFSIIERQMFNKARDIDVAIFNGLVDEDSKDFVLDCLTLYVNKDGGFGNALEIDNYNTNSSVYQTYEALRIMDMVGFDSESENPMLEEIVNRIGNYLFNRNSLVNGLWNPNVKTNDDFAHNLIYSYSEKFDAHPTAAILGYLVNLVKPSKVYYKKSLAAINDVIKYMNNQEVLGLNELISFNSLLGSLKKANLLQNEQKLIENKLLAMADYYKDNENYSVIKMLSNCSLDEHWQEVLDGELDLLVDSRVSHGLWEHKGDWGTNKYAEYDSATLKWIGAESVNNFAILLKYNRVINE
jgi:hypothetical protein